MIIETLEANQRGWWEKRCELEPEPWNSLTISMDFMAMIGWMRELAFNLGDQWTGSNVKEDAPL